MTLKLRPTGLGSGIDKDRPDYTVYCGAAGQNTRIAPRLSHGVQPGNDGPASVQGCPGAFPIRNQQSHCGLMRAGGALTLVRQAKCVMNSAPPSLAGLS